MLLNPLEFVVTFLPSDVRRLTRTGIQIHSLQYWADPLGQWVGQHRNVRVHSDPRDVSVLYVRSPAGLIVTARLTTPGVGPISLAEWESRRNHERAHSRDPRLVAVADASQKRNDQLVSEAKASRRVRRRKATEAAGDRWRPETAPPPQDDPVTPPASDVYEAMPAFAVSQIYDVEGIDDDY